MQTKHSDNGFLLDREGTSSYEKYVVPRLHGPWAETLVGMARLSGSERVLDAACGTGVVARLVASRLGPEGSVTGIDSNPHMVALARELAPAIEWREADLIRLPFPDGAFDVVFCQQGLQFVPDPRAALRDMRRVLAPGGRIVLNLSSSLECNPYMLHLAEALREHVGEWAFSRVARICRLSDRGGLDRMLLHARFHDVAIECRRGPLSLPPTAIFVPQHLQVLRDETTPFTPESTIRIIEALDQCLEPYVVPEGLYVPFELHYARARADSV